jgi:hypothetical protein
MPSDPIAPLALYGVARTLEIERERRVQDTPDGFTWWIAPGLHQRVQVEDDVAGCTPWLRITTPVWRGADPQAIAPLLDELRQHARGAAVRHDPRCGDVALVTRAPLSVADVLHDAAGFASTAGVQALLAAWAWADAAKRHGERARAWRAAAPHPERGMDVAPSAVLGFRERLLEPRLEAQGEGFGPALMEDAVAAVERDGLGLMPQRHPDGFKVTFAVDVGPTLALLEVGLIRGSADVRSLAVALTLHGHLSEGRAHAICAELLERQLAPGAPAWTLGSWSPIARRDGRPGFGLTHGLFLPLATAHPTMGRALGSAAGHAVASLQRWLAEGGVVGADGGGRMVA